MRIDLKSISSGAGTSIPFDYTVDLSGVELQFTHPFSEPVRIRGTVFNKADVFTLSAVVEAVLHVKCARCDRPIERQVHADVEKVLAKSVESDENDDIVVVGDSVELDEICIPELILATDMVYLCSEDCLGLCPHCGADLNDGPCGCQARETDPRLAVLQELLDRKD